MATSTHVSVAKSHSKLTGPGGLDSQRPLSQHGSPGLPQAPHMPFSGHTSGPSQIPKSGSSQQGCPGAPQRAHVPPMHIVSGKHPLPSVTPSRSSQHRTASPPQGPSSARSDNSLFRRPLGIMLLQAPCIVVKHRKLRLSRRLQSSTMESRHTFARCVPAESRPVPMHA